MTDRKANRLAAALGGLGSLAGLLAMACSADDTFTCVQDADCVLAGTPGICVMPGGCAYPDPSCPSGYAYPAGSARPGCAEPEGSSSGGAGASASGATSSSSTTSSSGGTGTTGTTGTTTTTSTSTTSASTGDTDPSGDVCAQEASEPNDEEGTAGAAPPGCEFEIAGALDGEDAADWFALEGPECLVNPHNVAVTSAIDVEMCVEVDCVSTVASVSCDGGAASVVGMRASCCGATFQMFANCGGDPAPVAFVYVTGTAAACEPYRVRSVPAV